MRTNKSIRQREKKRDMRKKDQKVDKKNTKEQ